jgi:hypothetical protein
MPMPIPLNLFIAKELVVDIGGRDNSTGLSEGDTEILDLLIERIKS